MAVPGATYEYHRFGEFRLGRPVFENSQDRSKLYVSEESGGKWFIPYSLTVDFVGNSAPCCPLGVNLRNQSFLPESYQVTKCSAHQ